MDFQKITVSTARGATTTFVDTSGQDAPVVLTTDDRDRYDAAMAATSWEQVKAVSTPAHALVSRKQLSTHLTYEDGVIRWDGVALRKPVAHHLVRMLESGDENWHSVVAFMERLASNPSGSAKAALWSWLDAEDFTLTRDGMILGYKGVRGDRRSKTRGHQDVSVNGEVYVGHIPNPDGAVVEMARDEVDPVRASACSVGLHVGTYGYARDFANSRTDRLVRVLVDPADVVMVPEHENGQKMRVCRYQVLDSHESKVETTSSAVTPYDDDDDECIVCGDEPEMCACDDCGECTDVVFGDCECD